MTGLRAPQAAKGATNKDALWTGTYSSRGQHSLWSLYADDDGDDNHWIESFSKIFFWKVDFLIPSSVEILAH